MGLWNTAAPPVSVWNVDYAKALLLNTKGGIAGFCFVLGWVLFVVSHVVCQLLLPSYRKLSTPQKVDWNSRVVSNINAVVSTYGAVKVLFYSNVYDKYPLTTWNDEAGLYIQILLGYFAYDLLLCLSTKELRAPSTLAHHIMGLLSYSLVYYTGHGQYMAMLWMATELTTPLVNNRWFLAAAKRSDTQLYILNGLVMALAFLLWRVIYIPITALHTLYKFRDQMSLVTPVMKPAFPIFLGGITILNTYWTYLMFKGIVKKLSSKKPSKTASAVKVKGEPELDETEEDVDTISTQDKKDLKDRKKKKPIDSIKSIVSKMKPNKQTKATKTETTKTK